MVGSFKKGAIPPGCSAFGVTGIGGDRTRAVTDIAQAIADSRGVRG